MKCPFHKSPEFMEGIKVAPERHILQGDAIQDQKFMCHVLMALGPIEQGQAMDWCN